MKQSMRWVLVVIAIAFVFFYPTNHAFAQESDPTEYPTYIIQPGDSLANIALKFGISLDDLISFNNIENPNAISAGTEILLPGMEGISGILTTIPVALGDSLHSLSVQYQVDETVLIRLNKLSSLSELFQNANLILPIDEESNNVETIGQMNEQLSIFEMAVIQQVNDWQLNNINKKTNTWAYTNQEPVYTKTENENTLLFAAEAKTLVITPEILKQGDAAIIRLSTNQSIASLEGALGKYPLHFFEETPNEYVAYQGIYAQLAPGLIQLSITGSNEAGKAIFSFEQMLIMNDSLYPSESLTVAPETIDPQTMDSEQAMILEVVTPATPDKYFQVPFGCMLDQPTCISSWFGTNRNYNDGLYYNFHSGLDYGVCASLNIYAPVDGTVVYTGLLTVRGNTTYIDHGWGVYSGIFHQEQILVNPGDFVTKGQLIGTIGATGRVTGPHLHYEIIVNGNHIDPRQWLDENCQ